MGFAAGSTSLSVWEYVGNATLTVQLSAVATAPVTVTYATADGDATSDDYTMAFGTLAFAVGDISKVGAWGVQEG